MFGVSSHIHTMHWVVEICSLEQKLFCVLPYFCWNRAREMFLDCCAHVMSWAVAGLLGTVAFAFFCFYLLLAVISGEMQLGLNFLFITIHPMKYVVQHSRILLLQFFQDSSRFLALFLSYYVLKEKSNWRFICVFLCMAWLPSLFCRSHADHVPWNGRRWNGTLMSSFLFNVGLILICSIRSYMIFLFISACCVRNILQFGCDCLQCGCLCTVLTA